MQENKKNLVQIGTLQLKLSSKTEKRIRAMILEIDATGWSSSYLSFVLFLFLL